MPGPPGSVPRPSGQRATHPGVVFASLGCCQPREKMDEKVAKAMYGDMADDKVPRKKKEAYCSYSPTPVTVRPWLMSSTEQNMQLLQLCPAASWYETGKELMGDMSRWCFEFSVHYYIKETQTWLCDACKGRTDESSKCSDCMARLEGSGKSSAVCAKSQPNWEETLDRKKKTLSKPRNVTKIRYEMSRESPFRHLAQKEGLVRPFLYLASMSPHLRSMICIQLGFCPFVEEYFGDAHEEAWQILNKKGMGLRARCIRGIGKFNPFQAQHDWVGILNHVAQTLYVPSYMSWNDEFTCEKLGKSEGHEESMLVHSSKVDQFENELMEKVSKQQRSKMNRVQVCTVAQLMTSDNLRKLMAIQQGKGVERHTMSLFAIDSCYLQLARDKHLLKGQDADPVEPDEIAASVAQFLSNGVEGDIEMFAEAGLRELPSPPPESVLNANFEPLWLTLGTLGQKPHSTMARILPVLVEIFLQKEKLKMAQINISSSEFSRPAKDV